MELRKMSRDSPWHDSGQSRAFVVEALVERSVDPNWFRRLFKDRMLNGRAFPSNTVPITLFPVFTYSKLSLYNALVG